MTVTGSGLSRNVGRGGDPTIRGQYSHRCAIFPPRAKSAVHAGLTVSAAPRPSETSGTSDKMGTHSSDGPGDAAFDERSHRDRGQTEHDVRVHVQVSSPRSLVRLAASIPPSPLMSHGRLHLRASKQTGERRSGMTLQLSRRERSFRSVVHEYPSWDPMSERSKPAVQRFRDGPDEMRSPLHAWPCGTQRASAGSL